jgi:hypothetical protein
MLQRSSTTRNAACMFAEERSDPRLDLAAMAERQVAA